MLKKIPYALLLLAAYVVVSFSGVTTALAGNGAEAANAWESIGRIVNYIVVLGPMLLAVLVIINSIKPLVGQIGGVLCLLLAVSYGYRGFTVYLTMSEYLAMAEDVDAQVIYFMENMLSCIVFALVFWLAGAKIQDEEVSGLYSAIANIGIVLTVFLALSGTSANILPFNVIPSVLLMCAAKQLPAVFVPGVTARGIKVKNIVILAILMIAYFAAPAYLY